MTGPGARLPSPRRRWAFRVVTALTIVVVAFALVRGLNELRALGEPREPAVAPVARGTLAPLPVTPEPSKPGPGDPLHAACQLTGPDCVERYGPGLQLCYEPACVEASGFSTTPQGLLGPVDRVYPPERDADVYRILAVGGSTTAGVWWRESWPAELEVLLRRRAVERGWGVRVEVLNLGKAGAGSRDVLELYRHVGAQLRPDLVVIGEQVNDLGGCDPFRSTAAPGGGTQADLVERYLVGEASEDELRALSPWFDRHAPAFAELRAGLRIDRGVESLRELLGAHRAALHAMDREKLVEACRADEPLDVSAPSIYDDFEDGWAFTRDHLDALVDEARASGATDVAVSTVPHDFEDWRCPTPTCPALPSLEDWARYFRHRHNPSLRAWAAERGLVLAELERGMDAFGRGEAPAGAPLEWIFQHYAAAQAIDDPVELERRFRAGEIGKAPLFLYEWMHPSPDGYRVVASLYLEALTPTIEAALAERRAAAAPGETLRLSCHASNEECDPYYGPGLTLCHLPSCREQIGFTSNAQGLAAPPERVYAPRPPEGTYRILAFGGSTTVGTRWWESWPHQLEVLLGERAAERGWPLRFEVLNLAKAGASSGDVLRIHEVIGRIFAADLVIVGEEVNDLGGCSAFARTLAPDGSSQLAVVERYLTGGAELDELRALSPWFERHARSFEEQRRRWSLLKGVEGLRAALGAHRERLHPLPADELIEACRADEPLDMSAPSILDDWADGWGYTRGHLERMLELAREDGIPAFAVSTVPHAFEHWRCPTPTCPPIFSLADWARYYLRNYNPELRDWAARRGALLVELEHRLDAFARGEALAGASASWVYQEYAEERGLDAAEVERRHAAGEIGKAPLFLYEWMHPSPDGLRAVAAVYLEAITPTIEASLSPPGS